MYIRLTKTGLYFPVLFIFLLMTIVLTKYSFFSFLYNTTMRHSEILMNYGLAMISSTTKFKCNLIRSPSISLHPAIEAACLAQAQLVHKPLIAVLDIPLCHVTWLYSFFLLPYTYIRSTPLTNHVVLVSVFMPS